MKVFFFAFFKLSWKMILIIGKCGRTIIRLGQLKRFFFDLNLFDSKDIENLQVVRITFADHCIVRKKGDESFRKIPSLV